MWLWSYCPLYPFVVGSYMNARVLVDTRAFFDAAAWEDATFCVYTLGGRRRRTACSPWSAYALDRRRKERPASVRSIESIQMARRDDPARV